MDIMINNNTNEIMFISEAITEEGDRYKVNKHLYVMKDLSVKVATVDSIPDGIEPYKYCYTEEQGFYFNPNWHEPITPEIEINKLKEGLEVQKELNDELQFAILENNVRISILETM